MSTTVDQRVVQMRFDNQQFESGVQSTISSLGKLKQSLDFSSASKGLEQLQKNGNSFDLSNIGEAVQTVSSKFTALGVVGFTALQRITNAAINTGTKMIKALTITPVLSGFREYETQINATQTILSNTSKEGATIKDVNAALDELNKYADLTIYNFTEMTKNIGTFTAAGVKLKTSVNAIQGIANLAAASGSTSQQASTAMYQLSQALASGTVKLMDWNSVVNAGMGGAKFQDALKMTAKVHGVAIDSMIKKEGSFRETLKNGWLTSDILTETLQHFTEFTDEYNEKTLKAQGYTKEQIAEIKQMGIDATEAATKVKTFTQLWDVLQEAAQSGWAQSWRLIIGDFEQAKTTLTEFSDILTEVINESSAKRNAFLTEGLTSGFNQFVTDAGIGFEDFSAQVQETAKKHGVAIDKMIEEDDTFEESLHRGWMTGDILKESINETTKSLSGMSKEELKTAGYTEEQVKALKKFNKQVKDGTINVDEWAEKMGTMSGRENLMESLLNIFRAIMALAKPIKEAFDEIFPAMTGEQLYDITEKIRDFTAKLEISEETAAKVKDTFKGIFSAVKPFVDTIKVLGEVAVKAVKAILPLGGNLLNITSTLGTFVYEQVSAFNASERLQKVLEGLNDICGFIEEKFDNLANKLGPVLTQVFEYLKKAAGELFMAFNDAFSGGSFAQLFTFINGGLIANLILTLKKGIKDLIGDVKSSTGIIDKIKGALDGVREALETWQATLKADIIKKIALSVAILAAALVALALVNPANLAAALGAITILFKTLMSTMEAMAAMFDGKKFKGVTKAAGLMMSLALSIAILAAAVRIMAGLSWSEMATGLVGTVVLIQALVKATEKLSAISKKANLSKLTKALIPFAVAIGILALSVRVLADLSLVQLAQGLGTVAVGIYALVGAAALMSKLKGGMTKNAKGLLAMAVAIGVLALSIKVLADLDLIQLGVGLGSVIVLMGAMVGAAKLLNKNAGGMTAAAVGMVAMAAAIRIIVGAIAQLGAMDQDALAKGLVGVGTGIGIITASMKLMADPKVLAAAGAFLIAAGAYTVLVGAMKLAGTMSWESIGKGLVVLAGAFVVLGVAAVVLGPAVVVILALAGALALAGVGVLALGVGVLALGAGLTSLSIAIGTFAAALAAGTVAIVEAISAIILGIVKLIPEILKVVGDIIVELCNVVIKSAPKIAEAILTVIDETLKAIANHAGSILDSLIQILAAIFDKFFPILKKYGPKMWEKAKEIGGEFLEGIGEGLGDLWETGKDAVQGFIQGVKDNISDIVSSALDVGKSFLDSLKNKLGIASPSKQAKRIAKFVVEGFTLGIDQNLGDVKESADNLADTLTDTLESELANLFNEMTFGRKATALFMREFGDISSVEAAKKSFEQASNAVKAYAKELYKESDAYKENKQAVKDLKKEQASLEKQIKKLSKKTDDESKNNLKTVKENLKETKKELKKAKKEITEGTKQFTKNMKTAYEDMQSSIADSLKSYMDPLSVNLDTQLDMFKKFEEDTDEITASSLLENMKSQIEGITSWNDRLDALADKGFANAIIEELKDLGPTAVNYIKAFEAMTAEEMAQANAYFKQSSQITAETFLGNWADTAAEVETWTKNLQTLAERKVAQGLIEACTNAGMSSASFVAAFVDATDEQIAELNKRYKSFLTSPNLNAQKAMLSAVTADAGMGAEFSNALKAQIAPESEAGTVITETAAATGTAAGNATATGIVTATTSTATTAKVTDAAEQLGTATVNGVSSKVNVSSGKRMGKNLCAGLVKGIKEGRASVIEAAKEVANSAVDGANENLGIESPSKVFMRIGYYCDEGFAKGLRKYSGKVEDATGEVGNSSLKGVKKALANIAKFVDSDMDTTPVIRPVIDLDNVQQGINSMNGMFSDQVIDVNSIRAKTASISSGMSGGSSTSVSTADGKLQNGNTFSFVQNNYSPKALSQIDIYRQTKNQFSAMKGALGGV